MSEQPRRLNAEAPQFADGYLGISRGGRSTNIESARAEAGTRTDGYTCGNPNVIWRSSTNAPTLPSPTPTRTLWCAWICPSVEPIPKPCAVLNLRSSTLMRQILLW